MDAKKLKAIKQLQQLCEARENIRLKLNWNMLKKQEEGNDLLYYEGEVLVGFLGIYEFGKKVELCGMVHPAYRRKGIFTMLMEKALDICEKRNYREILLNAPFNGEAAKPFIAQTPCTYLFSEYKMKWNETKLADVVVREATEEDRLLEIELDVQCFAFTKVDAIHYYHRIREEAKQGFHIIEYENQPVGKIRLERKNGETWIYGFAILPEFQGRGIGKATLTKIIHQEQNRANDIYLEVNSSNQGALHLYESLGFQAYYTQDYYVYR